MACVLEGFCFGGHQGMQGDTKRSRRGVKCCAESRKWLWVGPISGAQTPTGSTRAAANKNTLVEVGSSKSGLAFVRNDSVPFVVLVPRASLVLTDHAAPSEAEGGQGAGGPGGPADAATEWREEDSATAHNRRSQAATLKVGGNATGR